MARSPLILDCDTGTDDAVAIMLACLHPSLELRACTVVNGNGPVAYGTDNTLRVLANIGYGHVPVYAGAHGPWVPAARDTSRANAIHGLTLPLPPVSLSAQPLHAARFLVEQFTMHGPDLTLVATAPLTNIALAIALDPQFPTKVRRLIIMGGGHSIGNITASAEFNFWMDPYAAATVLAAGFPNVTLVTLDATHTALITYEDCERLQASGTPAALATAQLIRRRIDAHEASERMPVPGSAPVHDALCIGALIDPGVISTRHVHVDVETTGPLTVGRSVVDLRQTSDQSPNCHVALSAARTRFVELLIDTLTRAPQPA
jgi:inosine-uridine nucleoside N-ribohydrolase